MPGASVVAATSKREGGPRRIASSSASRTIWYSAACVCSPSDVDRRHVERDLDPVLAPAGLDERVDRRSEAVVAQRHRLEVEGEVA